MDAEAFHRRLSDYIDGELPDGDAMRMAQAIEEHAEFAEAYHSMSSLTRKLGELPELQPSAGFEFALRSRILTEANREQTARRRVQSLLFPTGRRSLLTGAIAAALAQKVYPLAIGGVHNHRAKPDVLGLRHPKAFILGDGGRDEVGDGVSGLHRVVHFHC